MDREKADAAILPKHFLRSIAVMHVPIDDQHAIELMLVDGNPRADGNVAAQAKAHWIFGASVMAGGTDEAQRRLIFTTKDAPNGPFEAHILEFPSDAALDAYMADPERARLSELRDRAIARTDVLRVDVVGP